MASLVLVAGTAALLPSGVSATATAIALGVAGTIGSIIDQKVLLPLLAKKDTASNPNAPDLSPKAEGSPANYVAGSHTRVPGNIMWQGPVYRSSDGKSWLVDLLVGFAYCPEFQSTNSAANTLKHAVNQIREIMANGERVYVANRAESQRGNVKAEHFVGLSRVTYTSNVANTMNFDRFYIGAPITISGFTTALYNAPFGNVLRYPMGSGTSQGGKSWMIVDVGVATQTATESASAALFEQKVLPSASQNFVTSVVPHLGDGTTNPASATNYAALKTAVGNNIPGFRYTCTAELNGFNISQFGNNIPPIEAILEAPIPLSDPRQQVTHICRMAGLESDWVNTSSWTPRRFWEPEARIRGEVLGFAVTTGGESFIGAVSSGAFTGFQPGDKILIAGAANASNNGIHTVKRVENSGGLPDRNLFVEDNVFVTENTSGGVFIRRQTTDLLHYVVSGTRTPAEMIEDILLVDDGIVQERNGTLYFLNRQTIGDPSSIAPELRPIAIDPDDLAAKSERSSDNPHWPMHIQEIRDFDLPTAVIVEFPDSENRMQPGSVVERIDPGVDGDNVKNIRTPIGMNHREASNLALRLLHQPRQNTKRVTMWLPAAKYLKVLENDIVTITHPNTSRPMRLAVVRRDVGSNWLMELECIEDPDGTLGDSFFAEETVADPDAPPSMTEPRPNLVVAASIPSRGV